MTNASGGIGSIVTGGLDPVKMWEPTMDTLILGQMFDVLHHPLEVVGLKWIGEEEVAMNPWKEWNNDLKDVAKSLITMEMEVEWWYSFIFFFLLFLFFVLCSFLVFYPVSKNKLSVTVFFVQF